MIAGQPNSDRRASQHSITTLFVKPKAPDNAQPPQAMPSESNPAVPRRLRRFGCKVLADPICLLPPVTLEANLALQRKRTAANSAAKTLLVCPRPLQCRTRASRDDALLFLWEMRASSRRHARHCSGCIDDL